MASSRVGTRTRARGPARRAALLAGERARVSDGQAEGQGLARAGAPAAEDVLAGERVGDRRGLDRERRGDAVAGEALDEPLGQPEGGEAVVLGDGHRTGVRGAGRLGPGVGLEALGLGVVVVVLVVLRARRVTRGVRVVPTGPAVVAALVPLAPRGLGVAAAERAVAAVVAAVRRAVAAVVAAVRRAVVTAAERPLAAVLTGREGALAAVVAAAERPVATVLTGRVGAAVATVLTGRVRAAVATVLTRRVRAALAAVLTRRVRAALAAVLTGRVRAAVATVLTGRVRAAVVPGLTRRVRAAVVAARRRPVVTAAERTVPPVLARRVRAAVVTGLTRCVRPAVGPVSPLAALRTTGAALADGGLLLGGPARLLGGGRGGGRGHDRDQLTSVTRGGHASSHAVHVTPRRRALGKAPVGGAVRAGAQQVAGRRCALSVSGGAG